MRYITISLLVMMLAVPPVLAQQWVNPHFDTHRMDFRDLGYPGQNEIPADNARITALMTHSNGLVYGATSGKTQAYLFFYNRYINKVRPLGCIAGETGVHHAMLEGKGGVLYLGTGLNMLAELRLTRNFPVAIEAVERQLWADIKAPYAGYPGGHIYKYNPETGDVKTYLEDTPCPLEDLGIPVPNNTIYAMTWNPDSTIIYGLSYPDAHFFIFDIATRKTTDLGDIMTHKIFSGPERHWRSVPRALYCDPHTGNVYTSGDNGYLLRYTPGAKKLELTYMRLPGEYYEGLKSWDYPILDCLTVGPDSAVYAGTNDGYLVTLDFEKEKVKTIGKPRMARRMRALAAGLDGNLYIITGEFERFCKLHTYDVFGGSGFQELGPFAVDHSPYYAWRAYQFDAMTVGVDGTVFCGESDRRGKLYLYIPGPGVFKEGLNPTNPVTQRQRGDTPGLIHEDL